MENFHPVKTANNENLSIPLFIFRIDSAVILYGIPTSNKTIIVSLIYLVKKLYDSESVQGNKNRF